MSNFRRGHLGTRRASDSFATLNFGARAKSPFRAGPVDKENMNPQTYRGGMFSETLDTRKDSRKLKQRRASVGVLKHTSAYGAPRSKTPRAKKPRNKRVSFGVEHVRMFHKSDSQTVDLEPVAMSAGSPMSLASDTSVSFGNDDSRSMNDIHDVVSEHFGAFNQQQPGTPNSVNTSNSTITTDGSQDVFYSPVQQDKRFSLLEMMKEEEQNAQQDGSNDNNDMTQSSNLDDSEIDFQNFNNGFETMNASTDDMTRTMDFTGLLNMEDTNLEGTALSSSATREETKNKEEEDENMSFVDQIAADDAEMLAKSNSELIGDLDISMDMEETVNVGDILLAHAEAEQKELLQEEEEQQQDNNTIDQETDTVQIEFNPSMNTIDNDEGALDESSEEETKNASLILDTITQQEEVEQAQEEANDTADVIAFNIGNDDQDGADDEETNMEMTVNVGDILSVETRMAEDPIPADEEEQEEENANNNLNVSVESATALHYDAPQPVQENPPFEEKEEEEEEEEQERDDGEEEDMMQTVNVGDILAVNGFDLEEIQEEQAQQPEQPEQKEDQENVEQDLDESMEMTRGANAFAAIIDNAEETTEKEMLNNIDALLDDSLQEQEAVPQEEEEKVEEENEIEMSLKGTSDEIPVAADVTENISMEFTTNIGSIQLPENQPIEEEQAQEQDQDAEGEENDLSMEFTRNVGAILDAAIAADAEHVDGQDKDEGEEEDNDEIQFNQEVEADIDQAGVTMDMTRNVSEIVAAIQAEQLHQQHMKNNNTNDNNQEEEEETTGELSMEFTQNIGDILSQNHPDDALVEGMSTQATRKRSRGGLANKDEKSSKKQKRRVSFSSHRIEIAPSPIRTNGKRRRSIVQIVQEEPHEEVDSSFQDKKEKVPQDSSEQEESTDDQDDEEEEEGNAFADMMQRLDNATSRRRSLNRRKSLDNVLKFGEDVDETMDFTKDVGMILQCNDTSFTNLDDENMPADEDGDSQSVDMELTRQVPFPEEDITTGSMGQGNMTTSSMGNTTFGMKGAFENMLFGDDDNIERTVDLPTRAKLSALTQDMAEIYEKILSGVLPPTPASQDKRGRLSFSHTPVRPAPISFSNAAMDHSINDDDTNSTMDQTQDDDDSLAEVEINNMPPPSEQIKYDDDDEETLNETTESSETDKMMEDLGVDESLALANTADINDDIEALLQKYDANDDSTEAKSDTSTINDDADQMGGEEVHTAEIDRLLNQARNRRLSFNTATPSQLTSSFSHSQSAQKMKSNYFTPSQHNSSRRLSTGVRILSAQSAARRSRQQIPTPMTPASSSKVTSHRTPLSANLTPRVTAGLSNTTYSSTALTETTANTDDDKKCSFQHFLYITGVKDQLEKSRKRGRDSEIPCGSLVDDVITPSTWPPVTLDHFLNVACVDAVEADDYGSSCLQLLDITEDIKLTVAQMEEWVDANPPALFNKLLSAKPSELAQAREGLERLITHCTLEAKQTWNEWRLKLTQSTHERMLKHLELLSQDIAIMEQLHARVVKARRSEELNNDPELRALRTAVLEQADMIASFTKDVSALRQSCQEEETKFNTNMNQQAQLETEIKERESMGAKFAHLNQDISGLQDKFAIMHSVASWAPTRADKTGFTAVFSFRKQKFELNMDWEMETGELYTVPTLVRKINRNSLYRPDNQALEGLWKQSQARVEDILSACTNKSNLKMTMIKLRLFLGRICDIAHQVHNLSRQFNIFVNNTANNVTVVASMTDQSKSRQGVLRFNLTPGFPACTNLVDSKSTSGLVMINASVDRESVLEQIKPMRGFSRMQNACKLVQSVLNQ